jgi:hypothetical protein
MQLIIQERAVGPTPDAVVADISIGAGYAVHACAVAHITLPVRIYPAIRPERRQLLYLQKHLIVSLVLIGICAGIGYHRILKSFSLAQILLGSGDIDHPESLYFSHCGSERKSQ